MASPISKGKQRKSYINDKVGAKGLNLFDTSRSIGDFQARTFTNMFAELGGSEVRYGFNIFNSNKNSGNATGGITMLHGFKATKFTPAFLTGGTSATSVVGTWTAVTDGSFNVTIDGTERSVTGIDFSSGVTTMADVASKIQTALRAVTSSTETVVWSTDHFIVTSASTTFESQVSVTSAQGGGTDISGAGGTPFMDAETGRGTATQALADGTQFKQIIFANDDDYYYLEPDDAVDTTWNSIGDYGTAVNLPRAYTSGGYTIFSTGSIANTPKKWNGLSLTNITTRPTSLADLAFTEFFQGQEFAALFGAGDPNAPSRLYYSDSDDPDVWSGGAAGFIDVAKDDGYAITGLRAQGDQLIVYKERNRYYISTFYESSSGTYGVRVLPFVDRSGGTLSHDTIQVLQNGDIVSLGHKEIGMQGIGKRQSADGSLVPNDYSRDIKFLFDQINYQQASKAKSVIFDKKLFLAVPFGNTATTNNYVFCYNIDTDAWSIFPDINIGCWLVFEDEDGNDALYAGHATQPLIYKFDKNEYTDAGEQITGVIRTGKLNLGSIIDFEDLEVIVLEGSMQEGDELKMIFNVDGVENTYTIDGTFIVGAADSGGYIANDYIADEYISGGQMPEEELRWMAILLPNTEQRKSREIEIQLENVNSGANWSWNYLSINEMSFNEVKLHEEKHVIAANANS